MIQIAIVEDQEKDYAILNGYLQRYAEEKAEFFKVAHFKDALDFIQLFKAEYGLIFLDIEMPYMSGMELAKRIRETDKVSTIIFITNMKQYAVNGYEVGALDFIVKPVSYYDFSLKLERALSVINAKKNIDIAVPVKHGVLRISSNEILYIEVRGHYCEFHTEKDMYRGKTSLSQMQEKLQSAHFMRCNNCYLVNPRFIRTVRANVVELMNGETLQISLPRKKQFIEEFTEWLGEGKNL